METTKNQAQRFEKMAEHQGSAGVQLHTKKQKGLILKTARREQPGGVKGVGVWPERSKGEPGSLGGVDLVRCKAAERELRAVPEGGAFTCDKGKDKKWEAQEMARAALLKIGTGVPGPTAGWAGWSRPLRDY